MSRIYAFLSLFITVTAFAVEPAVNNVVQLAPGAPQFVIAAAGNLQGGNGTYFRSDITVINFASHAQTVQFQWLPQAGGTPITHSTTINSLSAINSEDFVGQVIGAQGLGALVVTGLTSSGTLDPTAVLYATSRIWTPQPGTTGTTSQSLNIVTSVPSAMQMAVFGLRRDSRYRANVGIVNLDTAAAHTFLVDLPCNLGAPVFEQYTVTLAPATTAQVALTGGCSVTPQVNIYSRDATPGPWLAYGSSVDNVTGDAWTELALPGRTP